MTAPSNPVCQIGIRKSSVSCSVEANNNVEATLIEYLDIDGRVVSSSRIRNESSNLKQKKEQIGLAVSVRFSALTGDTGEWIRRGDSVTVKIQNRFALKLTTTAQ